MLRADGATGLSSMHALTGERLTLRDTGLAAQQDFQQQVALFAVNPLQLVFWYRLLSSSAFCWASHSVRDQLALILVQGRVGICTQQP